MNDKKRSWKVIDSEGNSVTFMTYEYCEGDYSVAEQGAQLLYNEYWCYDNEFHTISKKRITVIDDMFEESIFDIEINYEPIFYADRIVYEDEEVRKLNKSVPS